MQKYEVEAIKNNSVIMQCEATETSLRVVIYEMSKLVSEEEMIKNKDITFSIVATPFFS